MHRKIVRKFLSWSLITYTFSLLNAFISVYTVSIAVSFYGFDGLGVITTYFMFTASNGFLSLFDLGLSPIITRKVSIAVGSGKRNSSSLCARYLSLVSSHCLSLGLGVGLLAVIFIFSSLFIDTFHQYIYHALLLAMTGVQLFNFFSLKIHEAYRNILLSKLIEFFIYLSYLMGLFFLHHTEYSVDYFALIIVITNIIVFSCNIFIFRKYYKVSFSGKISFSIGMLKGQLDLFKLSLSSMFYAQYPKWMILYFLGTHFLGVYEAIMRIPRFIKFSIGAFSSVVVPLLSANVTNRSVCFIFEKSYLYISSLVFFLVLIILQMAEKTLALYLNDTSYVGFFSISLLWSITAILLSLGAPFLIALGVGYSFLQKNNLLISVSSFIVTFPLIINFGLVGVLWAQLIGVVFIPYTLKEYSYYTGCDIWSRPLKLLYIAFIGVLVFYLSISWSLTSEI